ncbi:MAG: lipoprotein NlpD [Pseudomonadales bacterium]|jgi:lipoprotein NlpD
MLKLIAKVLVIAMAVFLAACSHQPNKVSIIDRSSGAGTASGSSYKIKRGDTLYAIAWRYGVSYQQLADYNKIATPYMINIGQKLRIPSKSYRVSTTTSAGSKSTAKSTLSTSRSVAKKPIVAKTAITPGVPKKNTESWRWPTNGTVEAGYTTSGKIHKGIDIAGKYGQAIYAAKSGKVVYAGAGLKAYGLLIIVKHDEHFLSAYAFNSKVFVTEGDQVKAGDKIAEMGKKESKYTRLHFEIRFDGKPQNPKKYLPALKY